MRFRCQSGCTRCCRVPGGFVYLTEEDLLRAARYLAMSAADFEAKYVVRTPRKLRLRNPRHGHCHFLDDDGCRIHAAKPTQCRLYPFWPQIVKNQTNWKREAKKCPGIGQGDLIQIQAARAIANEITRAKLF